MRTRGGKGRLRKPIGEMLTSIADRLGVCRIEDRCCGSLAVTRGVHEVGGRVALALDANEALICTYKAVRDGWIPPRRITKERYQEIRKGSQPVDDPMTAFAMLFCSYGGKWGAGLIPDDLRWPEGGPGRHASVKAHLELLELVEILKGLELVCADAWDMFPETASVLYFDPPYAGSEEYAFAKSQHQRPFDRPRFGRELWAARKQHAIIVSEFDMPAGWREIKAIHVKSPGLMANKVERFFTPMGGLAEAALMDR